MVVVVWVGVLVVVVVVVVVGSLPGGTRGDVFPINRDLPSFFQTTQH
jgi:hypothetical protein